MTANTTPHFTPENIVWFKNVTNHVNGQAYMEDNTDDFVLHFPGIHGKNAQSPRVGELILLRQKINNVSVFTHLVTPIDDELVPNENNPRYRYGRNVRVIAKTSVEAAIPIKSTEWRTIKFVGITQGNVCQIENIRSVTNIETLRHDTWNRFAPYLIEQPNQNDRGLSDILKEIEINNPELTGTEGKRKLAQHYRAERDPKIIAEKKRQALQTGNLHCEVCTFSFQKVFQQNFIECHHIFPIASNGIRETKLEDLALVCANCHRMLHKKFNAKYLNLEELRERIQ